MIPHSTEASNRPPARGLTFQWEPVRQVLTAPNFRKLNFEHWLEAGRLKGAIHFDPDFQRMIELSDLGIFRVWTARTPSGALAGYAAFVVSPSLHHKSSLWAFEDSYVLHRRYRKGLNGYRMIATAVDALRAAGVKAIVMGGPEPIFRRLHFEVGGRLFYKAL